MSISHLDFVKIVSANLNAKLDIEGVSEEAEQKAIESVVNLLAPYVPQSLRQVMVDASDGLDDAEIEKYENQLVESLNSKIDLPFVSEFMEAQILKQILQFARQGVQLVR